MLKFGLFGAAIAAAQSGSAQVLSGRAEVLDGDTLVISGRPVRLFGIDAPELDQTCQKDNQSWACGAASKQQLASMVLGLQVECRGQGVDQFARVLAVCHAGGYDLNRAMVEHGWAVAYRQFSDDYSTVELDAKSNSLGIWSSKFEMPWDYRQAQLPSPALSRTPARPRGKSQPPAWTGGCLIKGNRNRRGEWIYHLPGMPYYNQTRAEEIFCTEAEARAAGYRRAIVKS